MAEKAIFTRAKLESITAGLSKLKKKEEERFGLKAAIGLLSPTITDVLAKGFSYSEIAEILRRDYEIDVKPSTMASYHRNVSASEGKDSQTGPGRRLKRGSDTRSDEIEAKVGGAFAEEFPHTTAGKFIQDPEL